MGEQLSAPLDAALDAYLDDMLLAGLSPKTTKGYRSQLRVLRGRGLVYDFTPQLGRSILADAFRRGLQAGSVRTLYVALAGFSKWCVENHYLAQSPMTGIPCPRDREKPHRYLSEAEVARVWKAACESRRRPEDNMLAVLLLLEGLRASERIKLRWQDVLEDRIIVAFGKGRTRQGPQARAIRLSAPVRALLERRERRSARILPMSISSLAERLQRVGRRAGVAGLHPHLFRHTFGSQSLLAGMDRGTLATLGGWSPKSTVIERYLRSARENAAIARADELGLVERLLPGRHEGAEDHQHGEGDEDEHGV